MRVLQYTTSGVGVGPAFLTALDDFKLPALVGSPNPFSLQYAPMSSTNLSSATSGDPAC